MSTKAITMSILARVFSAMVMVTALSGVVRADAPPQTPHPLTGCALPQNAGITITCEGTEAKYTVSVEWAGHGTAKWTMAPHPRDPCKGGSRPLGPPCVDLSAITTVDRAEPQKHHDDSGEASRQPAENTKSSKTPPTSDSEEWKQLMNKIDSIKTALTRQNGAVIAGSLGVGALVGVLGALMLASRMQKGRLPREDVQQRIGSPAAHPGKVTATTSVTETVDDVDVKSLLGEIKSLLEKNGNNGGRDFPKSLEEMLKKIMGQLDQLIKKGAPGPSSAARYAADGQGFPRATAEARPPSPASKPSQPVEKSGPEEGGATRKERQQTMLPFVEAFQRALGDTGAVNDFRDAHVKFALRRQPGDSEENVRLVLDNPAALDKTDFWGVPIPGEPGMIAIFLNYRFYSNRERLVNDNYRGAQTTCGGIFTLVEGDEFIRWPAVARASRSGNSYDVEKLGELALSKR